MNQEKALHLIKYYQNKPQEKQGQSYELLQRELFAIRENGVNSYVSVMNYALDTHITSDHNDFHIPYDISYLARKQFQDVHGGIPREHAGMSRSAIGFSNQEQFLALKEDFKVYELFAEAGMNQARLDFHQDYKKEENLRNEQRSIKIQEQANFEESEIYKYSKYISSFFFVLIIIWTPISMIRHKYSLFFIGVYILLSLALYAKKKFALYIFIFLTLLISISNGISGIFNLLIALVFMESHYYNGEHIYNYLNK